MRIVRYAFIGGCTTLVNFVAFWLLKDVCSVELNLSNTIAVVSSIIFAYIANKLFVFKSRAKGPRELFNEMLLFFASRAATMLLDIGAIFLIHSVIGVDERYAMASKIIVNIVVIVLNYLFSQRIFSKERKNA